MNDEGRPDISGMVAAAERIRRMVTVYTIIFCGLITTGLPLGTLTVKVASAKEVARVLAQSSARQMSTQLVINLRIWRYQQDRLTSQFAIPPAQDSAAVLQRAYDLDGRVLAQSGVRPGPFAVASESPLSDGISAVGRVEVMIGLGPAFSASLVMLVIAVVISASVAAVVWGLPLRAVDQALGQLRGASIRVAETSRMLREMEKMNALGTLSSGIAHNLNNLLFPILALSEATMEPLEEGSPQRRNLKIMFDAAGRARDLVARILAFSHRSEFRLSAVDIATLVRETADLIRTSLPSSIGLDIDVSPGTGTVMADSAGLTTVVMNLVANAVDAIGVSTGHIALSLRRVGLGDGDDDHPETRSLPPGLYAKLTVTDDGIGMDEDVRSRIFEPFFTTKEASKNNLNSSDESISFE